MVEIHEFTYRYPATGAPALDRVSLEVEEGSFVALIGPNGAGKSTLCYALTGFAPHFFGGDAEGRVVVAGHDLTQETPADLAGEVGLVFQDPFNQISGARFTVREELAFGLENLGVSRQEMDARIDRMLQQTGLAGLSERSPYGLSGGQQQRLALASVMIMEPRLLVLDEPTSQLDPAGTLDVFQALDALTEDRRTTVVIAEHKLEWIASFADRALLLEAGQVVDDGPPRQVLTGERALRAGLKETYYTRAARLGRDRGLVRPDRPLPVDLDAAVQYFQ